MVDNPRRRSLDRVALISDVHGNLTALEAVLEDIDARGVDRIVNLGDYVGKGPRGREVIALAWWLGQLSDGQGEWLRGLPFSHDFLISGRQVRLFHASPTTVHRRVRFDHDEQEFLEMFGNTPATGDGPEPTVVGYGDTHDPYYEVDRAKRTLFNTGSVGNSMDDPTPVYVIVEGRYGSTAEAPFSLQFVRVPYDVEMELLAAKEMDMPEFEGYASELRYGIYRGEMNNPTGPGYHRRPHVSSGAG